jgi:hypothetical protein
MSRPFNPDRTTALEFFRRGGSYYARQKAPTLRGVVVRTLGLWSAVFVVLYAIEGKFMLTRAGLLIFACTMSVVTIPGIVVICLRWRREKAGGLR